MAALRLSVVAVAAGEDLLLEDKASPSVLKQNPAASVLQEKPLTQT